MYSSRMEVFNALSDDRSSQFGWLYDVTMEP